MLDIRNGLRALIQSSKPTAPTSSERALYPKADGWYEEDSAGNELKLKQVIAPIAAQLTADVTCTASATTTLTALTLTLPVGQYLVLVGISFVGGGATAADMVLNALTATATFTGQQSINLRANAASAATAGSLDCLVTVTVAGTIRVQVACGANAYTAKQLSNFSSFAGASGIIAIPMS